MVLGSRLPVKMTGYNIKEFSPNSKKIYVDIDFNEINKHTFNIDLPIVEDLPLFFDKLNNLDLNLNISDWQNHIKNIRNVQN